MGWGGVGWGRGIGEEVREDMKGMINDGAWVEYGGKEKTMRELGRESSHCGDPEGEWRTEKNER